MNSENNISRGCKYITKGTILLSERMLKVLNEIYSYMGLDIIAKHCHACCPHDSKPNKYCASSVCKFYFCKEVKKFMISKVALFDKPVIETFFEILDKILQNIEKNKREKKWHSYFIKHYFQLFKGEFPYVKIWKYDMLEALEKFDSKEIDYLRSRTNMPLFNLLNRIKDKEGLKNELKRLK